MSAIPSLWQKEKTHAHSQYSTSSIILPSYHHVFYSIVYLVIVFALSIISSLSLLAMCMQMILEHPPDSATGYMAWRAIILLLNHRCQKMVGNAGFEPALFFIPNEVPYQTRRISGNGGPMETQTPDLPDANRTLYQLRYWPTRKTRLAWQSSLMSWTSRRRSDIRSFFAVASL